LNIGGCRTTASLQPSDHGKSIVEARLQRGNRGQSLAFQELEEGPATSGDIAYVVSDIEFCDGGQGVTAACDCKRFGMRDCRCHHLGTAGKLVMLKDANWTVPDNRAGMRNDLGQAFRDIELEEKLLKAAQELGIGVDTLRVWERRFGFPTPERNTRGHRLYPPAQIDDLRIIKKLQNLGHRPKQLFALTAAERKALLNQQQPDASHQDLHHLVTCVAAAQVENELRTQLQQRGIEAFILEFAVPLLEVMDRGWLTGKLSIAREHLLSDCLSTILKEQLVLRDTGPKIVFMTLSGERHKLEELPVAEVTSMVDFFAADAVALSFSVQIAPRQAKQDLAWLRKTLPNHIKIIAGGFALRHGLHLPGISVCTDLHQISSLCVREFPDLNL